MKPHASHTAPDDIPPVHVLEAAENQDRKETEDLLAGFDRPGRGPKKPSTSRDFVDYYAKKNTSGAEVGPPSGRSAPTGPRAVFVPRQVDVETMVKPRKSRSGLPVWLGWVAAALAMVTIGGAVAFVATDERPSSATSTASTITALTAVPMAPARDDSVPPPAEPTATATTTSIVIDPVVASEAVPAAPPPSARPTARRDPRNAPSGAAAAASAAHASTNPSPSADRKPPPRDDFIRDL